jgi:hypothetical protein
VPFESHLLIGLFNLSFTRVFVHAQNLVVVFPLGLLRFLLRIANFLLHSEPRGVVLGCLTEVSDGFVVLLQRHFHLAPLHQGFRVFRVVLYRQVET